MRHRGQEWGMDVNRNGVDEERQWGRVGTNGTEGRVRSRNGTVEEGAGR